MSNHMHSEVWDEMNKSFPNLNVGSVEILEKISYFIPYFVMHTITFRFKD